MLFFILFPYGTDAPVYYLPIATLVLIVLNVIAFIASCCAPEAFEPFALQFHIVNPLQWLTCFFLHNDFLHLFGNMMFLAIFGLVVEGKIGWWRFVLIYFFIGLFASSTIQAAMYALNIEGGAVGASCAIFGIMAIAMIWAPENDISFSLFYLIFIRVGWASFEAPILGAAFGFIALNFATAAIMQFAMSSATAHLVGVVPGLIIGVLMVVCRFVDCEGFDLISTMRGRRGQKAPPTKAELAEQAERQKAAVLDKKQQIEHGVAMVQKYVAAGHVEQGLNRFERLRRDNHQIILPQVTMSNLIKGLLADDKLKLRAIPLMEKFLSDYDTKKVAMTLSLARMYVVVQQRPRKGIKMLHTLKKQPLTGQQSEFLKKLVLRAKRMIANGIMEVDD